MPITFDQLLENAGIALSSVHLVRHQDQRSQSGRTPYALWRNDREAFELYQSLQHRKVFGVGNLVASFVVTPARETLFAGLYNVAGVGPTPPGMVDPIGGHTVVEHNLYQLVPDDRLKEYERVLTIDWGFGFRSWAQRAGRGSKFVVQLRKKFEEDRFPGYLRFICPLSEIATLYPEWVERLREAKGVYLLTCPKTAQQYVGKASGAGGFYDRWLQHAAVGGDAVRFKNRPLSDYQVSILEVAGSGATEEDIFTAEYLWIRKLQSVEMGLNGNPLLKVEPSI